MQNKRSPSEAPNISYANEISTMMFGFGDSVKRNEDTVRLIESIVQKQLRTIIQLALKYSDTGVIKPEHLVFLLRHNKAKMQRFVKYLLKKQEIKKIKESQSNNASLVEEDNKCPLLEFIERIDETGEFMDMEAYDEVKQQRLMRLDRISMALDEKKYLEFSQARAQSFSSAETVHKDLARLRRWLDPAEQMKFAPGAMEVIAHMAYETVAEIVDCAFLVRMDAKGASDSLALLPGNHFTSTMFNVKHRYFGGEDKSGAIHTDQPAISVNEVKEVMRRVHSQPTKMLNFGGKIPESRYLFAL